MGNITAKIFFFLLIIIAVDLHADWIEQLSGYNHSLQSVSTIDGNNVWVSGGTGEVLRSTNGGLSWLYVGLLDSLQASGIIYIYALDSITAIIICYKPPASYLLRTSDGGQSWSIVLNQRGSFFSHFAFKDSINGFLVGIPVGNRWGLWKTSDAGVTWDSSGLYLPGTNGDFSQTNSLQISGDDIFFGTYYSEIFHSHDFGKSWNYVNAGGGNIHALAVSGNTGFAGDISSYKTKNGGLSWLPVTLPYGSFITSFTAINTNFWFTRADRIYHSSDNGNNFNYEHQSTDHQTYIQISMKQINGHYVGWAVENIGGHISKYVEPIGIISISSEIPVRFSLHQNYPNPFNPSTTIKFDIKKSSFVKLTVYNFLGKETEILANEETQPGSYEVKWNASNTASGVYFIKLIAEDKYNPGINYIETRKIVLLK